MSHPLLKQKNALFYYLLIWGLIAVLHIVLLNTALQLKWSFALWDGIVFNLIYAFLALSFWYSCKFISLEKKNFFPINHSLASIVSSLIWLGLSYVFLVEMIILDPSYQQFFDSTFLWRLLIGILFYFIIISFYYLLIYYQNFHEKLLRESELKSSVKEAELKTLKFQINPHFVFNSLNSINSLILSSPEKAGEMTIKLSEFLRSTLARNEIQTSKMGDEIRTAKLYLDIEKIRFEDKIRYVEELDPKCFEKPVPSMILQPLFENAVKHGVYESIDPVQIKFTCGIDKSYLKIVMENDYDSDTVSQKGAGVGLKNIENRLEKMYGQSNLLRIEKEKNIFRITIDIPI